MIAALAHHEPDRQDADDRLDHHRDRENDHRDKGRGDHES
jgi:hypothetical protein